MSEPRKQAQAGWPSPYESASQGNQQPGFNQQQNRPVLTPEEVAAFKECNRESFWYRCVPLSIIFVAGTQLAVNRGLLKPHPRYGAFGKNMAAVLLGYIIGKISYQGECREKIMRLPNSPIAEAFRKGKRGRAVLQDITMGSDVQPIYGAEAGEQSSSARLNRSDDYSSNLDYDADSNIQAKGLDDINRPSVDGTFHQQRQDQDMQRSYTSYDELRERNRKEYERRLANAAPPAPSQPLADPGKPLPRPSSIPTYDRDQIFSPSKIKRNQYGDVIED